MITEEIDRDTAGERACLADGRATDGGALLSKTWLRHPLMPDPERTIRAIAVTHWPCARLVTDILSRHVQPSPSWGEREGIRLCIESLAPCEERLVVDTWLRRWRRWSVPHACKSHASPRRRFGWFTHGAT